MLSSRFKPWHVPLFLAKYAWLGLRRRPVLVHFEVTMRCNARCGFCDYWKTPSSDRENETERCAEAARFFNPMLVTFTGGDRAGRAFSFRIEDQSVVVTSWGRERTFYSRRPGGQWVR